MILIALHCVNAFSLGRSENTIGTGLTDGSHDATRRPKFKNATTPSFAPKTQKWDQCIFIGHTLGEVNRFIFRITFKVTEGHR